MTEFNIVHEMEGEPELFWRIFFDDAYNAELYRRLQMKERTVLEQKETPEGRSWVVRVIPSRDLPGFMKKIVGGDFGYIERTTFTRDKNRLDIKIEPTMMKERTRIGGVYTIDPYAPGKLRRTFKGTVTVDLPLVGKKIEGVIIDDMQKSYATAAGVTREWLARGGKPA